MITTGVTLVMMGLAALAAFACVLTVVGAVQLTADRRMGYFHLVIPVILITTALTLALSGRSIEFNASQLLLGGGVIKHPLAVWAQRIGTIVILTVAAERIISHISRQSTLGAAPMLTVCFIAFWLGSVVSPMLFSAYPRFAHEGFYTVVIGLGALLLTAEEGEKVLLTARNSIFIFQIASYLMLLINSSVVMDWNYTQGLIPGLPRFAGLAPHALMMGMLAQLSLLCLWARPYDNRTLNRAAWALGLITLLLAQSKTGWISFFFCALAMYVIQNGSAIKYKLGDPNSPHLAILLALGMVVGAIALGGASLFGGLPDKIAGFLNSESGEQLTSLTGRNLIWAVAYEEWLRHPLFGYGPNFLDGPYRMAIGLPSATHGHNQYMDLLPRAGLAGAIPLTFYLIAMLGLSMRHAVASRGLTAALFIAIALRAVSEVPFTLMGYGCEFVGHLLLLILLPVFNAHAAETRAAPAAAPHYRPSPQT